MGASKLCFLISVEFWRTFLVMSLTLKLACPSITHFLYIFLLFLIIDSSIFFKYDEFVREKIFPKDVSVKKSFAEHHCPCPKYIGRSKFK